MLGEISMMQFSVLTGFGEFEIKYGGSEENRYQGVCQGNGASPAGWLVICAAMIACQ